MNILSKIRMLSLLVIGFILIGAGNANAQSRAPISFETFYHELSPYGRWVNHPEFGRVWLPDVEEDFQPYSSRGRWEVTEYGNTWVSDYEWGWAPFHYGKWFYDNVYGWTWIPGLEWAPAWVEWRSGDGYYGWAPIAPVRYRTPQVYWVFVPQRFICHPGVYRYRVPVNRVVVVLGRTRVINNYYVHNNRRYAAGPRLAEMERVTRSRVRVYDSNNGHRYGRSYASNNNTRGSNYNERNRNENRSVRNEQDRSSSGYNRDNRNDNSREYSRNTNRDNSDNNGQRNNGSQGRPEASLPRSGESSGGVRTPTRENATPRTGNTNAARMQSERESSPAVRTERSSRPSAERSSASSPRQRSAGRQETSRPAQVQRSGSDNSSAGRSRSSASAPSSRGASESSRPSRGAR